MFKLAIIIPTYNSENYIVDCMNTIISELTDEMEVLLIDDGSKDRTLEICKKYESKNVFILSHENHGVSYSRNRGIEESLSEYIMFVDSDDVLVSGWAKTIMENIGKGFDVIYFSGKVEIQNLSKIDAIDGILGRGEEKGFKTMASPWSKIFNRKFLDNNSLRFDERLINGEDMLFNLNVVLNADNFTFIKSSIYKYRVWGNSSTKKYNPRFCDSNITFLKLTEKTLNSAGIFHHNEVNALINYLFSYSIYLTVFLINTINNPVEREKAIEQLNKEEIKSYFIRFTTANHPKGYVRVIYKLMHDKKYGCSFFIIKCLNNIRFLRNLTKMNQNKYYFLEV